tara:strand:- start:9627 stop:9887 length:261 start_codon:yes stop_codon:yes gene_type:complete
MDSLVEAGVNIFGNDEWYEAYQNYLYEKYGFDTSEESADTYLVKSKNGDVVVETNCLEHAFYIVDDLREIFIQQNLGLHDFKVYGV